MTRRNVARAHSEQIRILNGLKIRKRPCRIRNSTQRWKTIYLELETERLFPELHFKPKQSCGGATEEARRIIREPIDEIVRIGPRHRI
jgi:hypothetical protein